MIYISLKEYTDDAVYYSLMDIQNRFKGVGSPYPLIDEVFERENRCQVLYDRKDTPVLMMFEDEDWFWFKAKWGSEK